MFKKTKKWFEVNGTMLGLRFAKAVGRMSAVQKSTLFENGYSDKEFYFTVDADGYGQFTCSFNTEKEANEVSVALRAWIKDVQ